MQARKLIIGVGNPYCGDDGVGPAVARRLKIYVPDDIQIREQGADGATLIESWKHAEEVILIDAVCSGAKAGSVHRFDTYVEPILRKQPPFSTHAMGISEAIELSRVLGTLPSRLIIYGIEGREFSAGVGLSQEVRNAVGQVVKSVLRDIGVTKG
jgi:hydrogenase maturation protease